MITLGSLLADVPHTRPAPVTGSATDPELIEQLGLQASRYEGPTGIVGVLHDACGRAGLKSASLWAAVPHYVSLTPSPRAAKALVDRLAELLEADVDTAELDEAAEAYSQQVSEAVAADAETSSYVEELERRVDELAAEDEPPLGRLDRRRADALPARAGERHGRRRRRPRPVAPLAKRFTPVTLPVALLSPCLTPDVAQARHVLAERERVALDAGREAELQRRVRVVRRRAHGVEPLRVHVQRAASACRRSAPGLCRGRRARRTRSSRGSAGAASRPCRRRPPAPPTRHWPP